MKVVRVLLGMAILATAAGSAVSHVAARSPGTAANVTGDRSVGAMVRSYNERQLLQTSLGDLQQAGRGRPHMAGVTTSTSSSLGAADVSGAYSLSGSVVSASTGAHLSGIQVNLYAGECMSGLWLITATSDASGNWSISSLPSGIYSIWFQSVTDDYFGVCYRQDGYAFMASQATAIRVDGADESGLIGVLPDALHVKGHVKTTVGIQGFEVDGFSGGVFVSRAALTASDGSFDLTMPKGDSTIWFRDPANRYAGGWLSGSGMALTSASATHLDLSQDQSDVEVAIPTTRHIKGKITTSTRAAATNVLVGAYLDSTALAGWAITATDGSYSIAVPSGAFLIGVNDYGNAVNRLIATRFPKGWRANPSFTTNVAQAVAVTVGSGDVASINVGYPVVTQVTGNLTDSASNPVYQVEVHTYAAGVLGDWTLTALDGSFSIPVVAGSYQFAIYDPAWKYAGGWYSTSGFKYGLSSASRIAVSTGNVALSTTKIPLASVPSAPSQLNAAGYNNSARIWWTQPGNTGGLDAPSYEVVASPGGQTCTATTDPSCFVRGLDNGTAYVFTVTPSNVMGRGQSVDSPAAIPAPTPDAPQNVSGIAYDGAVVVSWDPAADNGSPVSRYTARAGGDGGPSCVVDDPAIRTCRIDGLNNGTPYSLSVTATNAVGDGPPGVSEDPVRPRPGNSYVALVPNRIADITVPVTGATSIQVTDRVPGDSSRNVPAVATAVTGTLSVAATYIGWVALTPEPDPAPTISTINITASDWRSTGVTVQLGASGHLGVKYSAAGSTATAEVRFDVTGYFMPGMAGSTYVSLTPNRVLDTRNAGMTKLTAGAHRSFQVADLHPGDRTTNVPAAATSVVGNLTVTGQSAAGFLTVTSEANDAPDTVTLTFPGNDNRAAGVTVSLPADGNLNVTFSSPTSGATTNVIFDVTGYFVAGGSGAAYVPLVPNRIVDSRSKLGLSAALSNKVSVSFPVINRSTDPTKNVPAGSVAVTGTLTTTQSTAAGFFALTTVQNNNPTTSTMNFPKGDNRATGVTTPISRDGKLWITYGAVSGATSHVVFDVTGYFVS